MTHEIETDDTGAEGSAAGPMANAMPNDGGADPLRMLEALLFAAPEPMSIEGLSARIAGHYDVRALLNELKARYASRGVNLVEVAEKWAFRTAPDLAQLLAEHRVEQRKLSRAAMDTLAIIAYHQPVTRAEIEEIRGVSVSKGTLDVLLEIGWLRLRGRRKVPGRPVTYGTTEAFLSHFGLERISDLPGMDDLKAAGLLDLSHQSGIPIPKDDADLRPDEDPLDAEDQGEAPSSADEARDAAQ